MNNFFVFGMKRSGHHAVINWMCEQGKPSFHVNNIGFDFDYLHDPVTRKHSDIKSILYAKRYTADSDDPEKVTYRRALRMGCNLAVYSAEDKWFGLCSAIMREKIDCSNLTYVIVVRDPYNFIASRLKNKRRTIRRRWPAQMEIWKEHVRACLNKDDKDFVDINFNKWFVDKSYRKRIAGILNIPFTDKGLNDVRIGASSFDGSRFEGNAQKMGVLKRWRRYKNRRSYWDLIDDETVELSEQYFGLTNVKTGIWDLVTLKELG